MPLPDDFPIEAKKTVYSSGDIDLQQVCTCVSMTSTEKIILTSGKGERKPVIFGGYFHKSSSLSGLAQSSVVLQLAPVYRVSHYSEEESQINLGFSIDDSELEISPTGDVEGVQVVQIVVTPELQSDSTGIFTAQQKDDISVTFDVDAMEVFSYEGEFVRLDTFE